MFEILSFCFDHKRNTRFLSTDPPSSPPLISGVQDGGHTEGRSLSLSCSVTGGQPPVSSVTFWCHGGPGDSADTTATVNGVTTVTSGVTFDRLDLTMNGTVCLCSAHWSDRPSIYTQTATTTITVIGMYLKLHKEYNVYQYVACINQIIFISM